MNITYDCNMTHIDKNKQEVLKNLFSNFWWRLTNLYFIVNEAWETIKFIPNKIQTRILKEKWDFRDIILKYRQGWVSTLYIILMLDEVLFWWKNINNVFITHRQDLLDVFFQKAKFVYDNIPEVYKSILPKPTTDNSNELAFKYTQSWKLLNNRLKIWLDVRWQTPTRLHISEFAFMDPEKQKKLKLSIDQFRKTKITIETTANWVWNTFYRACMQAKQWLGSYKLLFFPWYIEERNVLPLTKEEKENFKIDEYEKSLINTYSLSLEQINWRRQKIHDANVLWEDWYKMFEQENPTTIDWAFASSWTTVFDLSIWYDIKKPIKEIEWWKFFQNPQDKLILWVDIAEWWIKWDYSTISARNWKWELVATLKVRLNEIVLAKKLNWFFTTDIWWWFYLWSVLVENNVWLAFINECKHYPWFSERMLIQQKDDKILWEEWAVRKYWFRTTKTSKDYIIRKYKWALYSKELDISEEIYSEIQTYIFDKNNRPNAISPNHDDLLMADMICYYWILHYKNYLLEYDWVKQLDNTTTEWIRQFDIKRTFDKNNLDFNTVENLLDWYSVEEY